MSLLTSHLLSATALAPILTTLLALADRTHHLVLQSTRDGIRVVLHHDHARALGRAHHHGLVAQVLTSLAARPAAGHPDHVIQFVTSTPVYLASTSPVESSPDPACGELPICWPPAMAASLPATDYTPSNPRPPPSICGGTLLSVRSIVFLI